MSDQITPFSYSPYLVALSVIIAIQASYVGLSLAVFIPGAFALNRRLLIAGAAITLAVGIWSMHFIGMLALKTTAPVDYAALPTLLSFLVCMLVVGVAIYLASLRSQRLLVIAAAFMGLGITTMHYVGMMAVHSVFHMNHDPVYALLSVAIAIAASGLALWLAFSADRRPSMFVCAIVLGCAVSGMHYTAIAGMTLHVMTPAPAAQTSMLSSDALAIVVSIVACTISAVFMLALVPVERKNVRDGIRWKEPESLPRAVTEPQAVVDPAPQAPVDSAVATEEPADLAELLPVEKNGARLHIAVSEIVSVHANAHYTYIFNGRDDLFCPLSITEIEARAPKPGFFRTHRSYIVNLAFVNRTKKSGDAAVIELDTPIRRTVPVSRSKVAALKQELANFRQAQPA